MTGKVVFAILLLVILVAVYGVLRSDQLYGPLVLTIAVLPLAAAAIAGFSIARINEVRSTWEHSYVKMIGCFLGSGLVLTIAGAIGISPWTLLRQ